MTAAEAHTNAETAAALETARTQAAQDLAAAEEAAARLHELTGGDQ